jgi:hypothetical protein
MVHLGTSWVNRIGRAMSFTKYQFSDFFYFGNT